MADTFLKVKNFAVSNLADDISDVATSLSVATGDGSLFPSTYPFDIRIGSELLRCTARSTDDLTVIRGAQGTTAAAHAANDSVELVLTAQHLDDITEIFTDNKIVCHEDTVVCHEDNVVLL